MKLHLGMEGAAEHKKAVVACAAVNQCTGTTLDTWKTENGEHGLQEVHTSPEYGEVVIGGIKISIS